MRELDGVNRKPWERQRSLSGRSQAGMFSLAFHEFRGSSEPTNLILARANMPDPPRRIFLAMGCFFPHEIATKETFSVLSSFACSLLYLLSLNVFGFFIFYFPTISLSSSIEFLQIFFHRTVWTAWSVFFGRFISCHPLTFFCFSALFITLRRLLQFSYISLLFLLRLCTLCLCSPLYSLRTFRSSLRLLFSNFHFPETHTPRQLSSAK